LLFYAYTQIEKDLAQDLLETTKKCSPGFFENLIIDLLLKMGYGGSLRDAGKAIGGTGDGGVDGIIKEDKLGLDWSFGESTKKMLPKLDVMGKINLRFCSTNPAFAHNQAL